jgi:DoxX-like family
LYVVLASRRVDDIRLKTALILFSAFSFLGYGAACFFWARMKQEFARYGLGSQRVLVGFLQWCAGIGLLVGLMVEPRIGQAASGGLALMMLVAVWVRIQIKDSLPQTLPALFYLALNAYLCLAVF